MRASLFVILGVIALAPPAVAGAAKHDTAVWTAIRARHPALHACVMAEKTRTGAKHASRVALELHVAPDGTLAMARVVPATVSPALAKCLVDSAQQIRFPPTKSGKPATYRYHMGGRHRAPVKH